MPGNNTRYCCKIYNQSDDRNFFLFITDLDFKNFNDNKNCILQEFEKHLLENKSDHQHFLKNGCIFVKCTELGEDLLID